MWNNGSLLFFSAHFPLLLLLLLLLLSLGEVCRGEYSRDDFPSGFLFGAGTSAYQVEGAVAEDGRSPSIWDTYTHAGKMPDKSTADVAADGYHKYKEDVKLMADTGLEAYRFSISWSRLLPNGRGAVNPKGLEYYNNLIDELVEHGIKPHITLCHLDLPQVLQDEYGGWLSRRIIDDFKEYADVCFREFGNRVSQWATIVEPNVISQTAYDLGFFPPERCSYPFGITNCSAGDSTVEPYIATHIVLLAHAAVYNLYKTKYKAEQNGQIGINVYSAWCYPLSSSSADVEATQRVKDFMIGWILNPLVFGDYPEVMKKIVGKRLPSFTESEAEQLKGSFDFFGLNHYTSVYVKDNSMVMMALRDYTADMLATLLGTPNDTSPYIPTQITADPPGLLKMLEYLKETYGNPPIYIEENGINRIRYVEICGKYSETHRSISPLLKKETTEIVDEPNDPNRSGYPLSVNTALNDMERVDYLSAYIGSTLDAIRNGSNVQGYFVWSFLDVFELLWGYESSYGLYHVDFKDSSRQRKPKLSAHWYSNFLKTRTNVISTRKNGLQNVSLATLSSFGLLPKQCMLN